MSALAIVLILLGALVLLLVAGGVVAASRRDRAREPAYARRVAEADQALQRARAVDRGWDREVMEQAARRAMSETRPGWSYSGLQLVLVDDRPGVEEDRAHFVCFGSDGEARVVLVRRGDDWGAEYVD